MPGWSGAQGLRGPPLRLDGSTKDVNNRCCQGLSATRTPSRMTVSLVTIVNQYHYE